MQQFQVRKNNFSETRMVNAAQPGPLGSGEIRVAIERFAFTANNITYAAAADMVGYWQFFPALEQEEAEKSWGVIPVWGFAKVLESNVAEVPVGERFFGYFPPADELIMEPVRVTEDRLVDGAAHRAELPPGYNLYRRVAAEPGYDGSMDNERMLLWPLFITSFCLWDSLVVNEWYGAQQIIVISASSKTSIGMAYALSDDATAPSVVGLTSSRNKALVESLGLYDTTATYDDLAAIDFSKPSVIVDMSGNSDVLGQLHKALGENMNKTVNVGITHWDAAGENPDINAQRSEFFFAPGHIQKRVADWGAEGFDTKSSGFVAETVARSRSWLQLRSLSGLDSLAEIYPQVCEGSIAPDEGIIITLEA
ncbi:MAG: DUF2855 family protein [Halioglobus sp.]